MRRIFQNPGPRWLFAGILAWTACGTTPSDSSSSAGPKGRSSSSFSGFPDGSTDRSVWVEAEFVPGVDPVIGEDLTPHGVLPVALRLGHLDAEWERTRLSRDSFDAHLYLQDGTVLGWLEPRSPDRFEAVQRAEALHGLEYSILPPWSAAEEGYVLFDLGPNVTIEGENARVRDASSVREVPLDGSLLRFRVETATGSREVSVGLRLGGGR